MPETMAQTLARLQAANSDIGSAISAKGVTVPSGSGLEDYPSLISSIPSGSSAAKTVQFIDYDGTLLYEYTPDEFLALSSMPANYDHTSLGDGLGQGKWNYSFQDAKIQVSRVGAATIGQTCDILVPQSTRDAITALDGSTYGNNAKCAYRLFYSDVDKSGIYIILNSYATIYIDWGDGSSLERYSGSQNVNKSHSYSTQGDYIVSVYVSKSSSSDHQTLSTNASNNLCRSTGLTKMYIDGYEVKGHKFSNSSYYVERIQLYDFTSVQNINFTLSGYSGYTTYPPNIYQSGGLSCSCFVFDLYLIPLSQTNYNAIKLPPSITKLSLNNNSSVVSSQVNNSVGIKYSTFGPGYLVLSCSVDKIDNSFNDCNIKGVVLPYYIPGDAPSIDGSFKNCSSMEYVVFSSMYPEKNDFKRFYDILNNSFQNLPTTCKIYVPQRCYYDYINWITSATTSTGMPNPSIYEYIGY